MLKLLLLLPLATFIVSLNVFVSFSKLFNFQCCELIYYSADSTYNPRYMENVKFVVFNDSEGTSRLNFTGNILTDLEKVQVIFEIKMKSNQARRDYDVRLIGGTTDSCKLAQGGSGNFLMRTIKADLEKYSNFKLACSHKKGLYQIVNYPRFDDKVVPIFFPKNIGPWELTYKNKGKIAKVPGFVDLCNIRIQGWI